MIGPARRLARRFVPDRAVMAYRVWQATGSPAIGFDLPEVPLADLFPGVEAEEVVVPASQIGRARDMVLPLADLLTVGAICRHLKPRRVFEIGTYTGSTTLVMALNTPADAEILTLDLPPDDLPADVRARFTAGSLFRGTPAEAKIRQLYGRAEAFDFGPYAGTVDLVYVDAVHTYEAVKQDTATALRMVRPGGLVVWDDYRWLPEHAGSCAGVTRWLNEFHRAAPCAAPAGTRLAVHRAPGA